MRRFISALYSAMVRTKAGVTRISERCCAGVMRASEPSSRELGLVAPGVGPCPAVAPDAKQDIHRVQPLGGSLCEPDAMTTAAEISGRKASWGDQLLSQL